MVFNHYFANVGANLAKELQIIDRKTMFVSVDYFCHRKRSK